MRNRILTAVVLIPLVVLAVLLLPTLSLALLLGLFVLVGGDEMVRACGYRAAATRVLAVTLLGMLGLALLFGLNGLPPAFLGLIAAWWLGQTLYLVLRRTPPAVVQHGRPGPLASGVALLLVAWLSLVMLHAQSAGPHLVLFLLVLIWVADSGAYFAGRAFGRRKLAPAVSPGKTWEGGAGALVGASACSAGLAVSGFLPGIAWGWILLLCLLTTAASIGGDLWESSMKRQAALKDSGSLLPGHGGVLDRIDSLIAAAPTFVFGLILLDGLA